MNGETTVRSRPPARFDAPVLSDADSLRVVARHDATAERRRYDAGFRQGHADGLAQAAVEVDAAIADHRRSADRLASLCAALDHAVAERRAHDVAIVDEIERTIAVAALQIAETLLEREVAERDAVVDTIGRCLRLHGGRDEGVRVRIHPEDLACAAEAAAAGLLSGGDDVELLADPTVERGGCVVEAGDLDIDGQLGPALARIHDALRTP